MANSNYTGHNKTKTMRAKKSELPPVCAKKSYKENLEKCTNSSHPSKIQKQACDSTVNDLDFKSEKRKLFSCDFEGCNKKYTKLSHLKVNKTFCIKSHVVVEEYRVYFVSVSLKSSALFVVIPTRIS